MNFSTLVFIFSTRCNMFHYSVRYSLIWHRNRKERKKSCLLKMVQSVNLHMMWLPYRLYFLRYWQSCWSGFGACCRGQVKIRKNVSYPDSDQTFHHKSILMIFGEVPYTVLLSDLTRRWLWLPILFISLEKLKNAFKSLAGFLLWHFLAS